MKATLRPNIAALRALESAVRHQSFSLAADELNVTHSAVSHQIRQLEALLDNTLFFRVGSEVIPTPVCSQLAERLRHGLAEIDAALNDAASRGAPLRRQLNISVMADFANVWLIPRLADFSNRYPDIDLSMTVHNDLVPPDPHAVDLGIWHRRIDREGFRSEVFLRDQVIAVCSPEFMAEHAPLTLDHLPEVPLLHFSRRSWSDFFQAAGLGDRRPKSGPTFSDASSLLNAAIAGLGVAQMRQQLAHPFLENGALVRVGMVQIQSHLDYYFVWQEDSPREMAIQCLREWLKQQFAIPGDAANGEPDEPPLNVAHSRAR
ncbi:MULTISPECIES: LysR substrate-binding domain-containing protein [Paraburkholderia]|uniref:LysR substrate-binding domain-containing protein n=1 Tax=Paraburkholderia metrosideri TaxID=580937 RepID=A0ABW9E4K7_9BURK